MKKYIKNIGLLIGWFMFWALATELYYQRIGL